MKKTLIFFTIAASILLACQNDKTSKQAEVTERKSTANIPTLPYTAEVNPETDQLELKFHKNAAPLKTEELISLLNARYQKISLNLVKQQHDTLFVKIPDAFYLTQDIGTTGAESYLAEATFALTEVKGIKAVHFDFEEGDHAGPKTYTRADFKGFR